MHIVAIDNSGSTSNKKTYWEKVQYIIEEIKGTDIRYILWNHEKIKNFTEKKDISKESKGCTDPSTFVSFLSTQVLQKNIKSSDLELTLITDGAVYPDCQGNSLYEGLNCFGKDLEKEKIIRRCIEECSKGLRSSEIEFKELKVYFLSTDSRNQSMNLSVAAPFIKKSNKYQTYVYDSLQGDALEEAVQKKLEEMGVNHDFNDYIKNGLRGTLVLNEKKSIVDKISRFDLAEYQDKPVFFVNRRDIFLQQIRNVSVGTDSEKLAKLVNDIKKLQHNLHAKITASVQKEAISESIWKDLRAVLKIDNVGAAIDKLGEIIKNSQLSQPLNSESETLIKSSPSEVKRLRSSVNQIIEIAQNIIKSSDSFEFNVLQNESFRLANAPKNNQQVEVELKKTAEGSEYECSITYDMDVPVLLIRKAAPDLFPVFPDKLNNKLDDVINNPLLLLRSDYAELYKSVCRFVDSHIGSRIFFTPTKQPKHNLFEHGCHLPQTSSGENNVYIEGIPEDAKTFRFIPGKFESKGNTGSTVGSFIMVNGDNSYDPATNFALSEIFFGNGKLLGPPALWLAVLYFCIQKSDRFKNTDNDEDMNTESNATFMEAFKAVLIRRLKSDSSYITLSGPQSDTKPLIRSPLDIAIYYSAISPKFYEHGKNNRLRNIITEYHLKLLDLLGYPYDREWTLHQMTDYRVFEVMMREEKSQAASHLRNWLRCLYQNSIRLEDGSIILLDGKSSLYQDLESFRVRVDLVEKTDLNKDDVYLYQLSLTDSDNKQRLTLKLIDARTLDKTSDEYLESLSIPELLALEKLLDKDKKAGDIAIPNELPVEDIPKPKKNYGYSLKEQEIKDIMSSISLSPQTMRPLLINEKNKHYRQVAEEKFGCPINKQLSIFNYYQRFVQEKEIFPSEDDLIRYMADKESNKEIIPRNTLPKYVRVMVRELIEIYASVIKGANLSVDNFVTTVKKSRSVKKRLELEDSTRNEETIKRYMESLEFLMKKTEQSEQSNELMPVSEELKKEYYQYISNLDTKRSTKHSEFIEAQKKRFEKLIIKDLEKYSKQIKSYINYLKRQINARENQESVFIKKVFQVMRREANNIKFADWIRAIYQNSMKCGEEFVFLDDGPSLNELNSRRVRIKKVKSTPEAEAKVDSICLRASSQGGHSLSIAELFALKKLADDPTITEDMDIANMLVIEAIPEPKKNYNPQENEKAMEYKPKICPLTMRPYTHDSSGKEWKVVSEEKFGPLKGQLPAYHYFIQYIDSNNCIPSKDEFIMWMAKQSQEAAEAKDTLPSSVGEIVDNLLEGFTEAMHQLFKSFSPETLRNSLTQIFEKIDPEQSGKPIRYSQINKESGNREIITIKSSQDFKSHYENNKEKIIELFKAEKEAYVTQGDNLRLSDFPVELFNRITTMSACSESRVEFENAQSSKKFHLLKSVSVVAGNLFAPPVQSVTEAVKNMDISSEPAAKKFKF